ncbi:protein SSUH2 homolog isoform X2 [Tetranychus urticae]|uniref:Uncharacterized protein n=1 Tax=Tetranychus urticae TaxID=32264 RepID=T1KKI8_TETUR|nr:protein SSUH2 homolog isoform X2 [Tetranychus urticae]
MWRYGDVGSMRNDKRNGLRNFDYGYKRGGKFGQKGSHGLTHASNYRKQSSEKSNSSRSSSFKSSFKRQYSIRVTPPPESIDEVETDPPSLVGIDQIKGYENAKFTPIAIPPPPYTIRSTNDFNPLRIPLSGTTEANEGDVREALLRYASSHYCYGKGVAKHMIITKMDHYNAFHYSLETFTENRSVCWVYEAYLGGHLDGPMAGQAPYPWDVHVDPPIAFDCHSASVPIPHTDCLRTCHICGGVGRKRCYTCIGTGWENCYSCSGDGYKPHPFVQGDNERCLHCHGVGKKKCWRCNGDGMSSCKICSGTGQIKCYIKLTVNWTNHVDDFYIGHEDISNDMVKQVTGQIVFDETSEKVWPINHFPENNINKASLDLLNKHVESYFLMEKPIAQRQRVFRIPVTRVNYSWKNKMQKFWVLGNEKYVFAPHYPQKYCCGCTII